MLHVGVRATQLPITYLNHSFDNIFQYVLCAHDGSVNRTSLFVHVA